MSEKIEEVAKAIWDVRRAHANNAGIFLEFWGDGAIPKANGIMDEARAAIGAMREPTEEMKRCSDEVHWDYSCHVCGGLAEGWHKMIDAALGEKL